MATRPLRESEIELARQVFEDKLPYGKVYLADRYFPFNEKTRTAVTAASLATFLPVRTLRSYTIFVGPDVYRDGADGPGFRDTFIHELTHVWQGYHRKHSWEYMVESMLAQGHAIITSGDRNEAYDYVPGEPWDSYNVEQQAHMVQDWFAGGMSEEDVLFPYIENHIRRGRN